MSSSDLSSGSPRLATPTQAQGLFWFAVACVGGGLLFQSGIAELLRAWQTPEYSHGPLIPVLSALLFLRQLKEFPPQPGPVPDRLPGLVVMIGAIALGMVGHVIQIADVVAYALIVWTGGVLLVSFGWERGRNFWPPILHLVYMLPLPGALYYGLSTWLQVISSELGVWFLQLMQIPVYLDGNIIDLGVLKLHVAEACSGLRYLFPILSFSYVFAVLYKGPTWHKAVLLLSAAPITVLMNSVRIAIASWIVTYWGADHLEGFTHFFEGWVIFITCVLMLFVLAWAMLRLHPDRPSLPEALDLNTDGLAAQAARIRLIRPSGALIAGAVIAVAGGVALQSLPQRELAQVTREPFLYFPRDLGGWESGPQRFLDPQTERILAADDYHSVALASAGAAAPVDLFIAWYRDQMNGGTHSPEDCLPGAGWEIAALERVPAPAAAAGAPFELNRAVIQKGTQRMLVYYWYDQQGSRMASAWRSKLMLTLTKARTGRSDGALVRLITPIAAGESEALAETRLQDALLDVVEPLPRFLPAG